MRANGADQTNTETTQRYAAELPAMLTEAATSGRRLTSAELASCRRLGERAAQDGRPLRELVGLYLRTARSAWGEVAETSVRAGQQRLLGENLLRSVETAVTALAEGYEQAQLLAVRGEETARREFIDDLLHGRSDLGRLVDRAERFGLQLAVKHTVVVARGGGYEDVHPATRRVERELTARFGNQSVLITTKDSLLVCIAASSRQDLITSFATLAQERGGVHAPAADLVAVGRAHSGPSGVVRSYQEALTVLDLADRLALPTPVLHANDLLVFPVLMRDRAAILDLVDSVLGPLATVRGGPDVLLNTLDAYFASGCVTARAARELNLSVRALTYRLGRIQQLTGFDPDDPLQRYSLQTAALGARLMDWPIRSL